MKNLKTISSMNIKFLDFLWQQKIILNCELYIVNWLKDMDTIVEYNYNLAKDTYKSMGMSQTYYLMYEIRKIMIVGRWYCV